MWESVWIQTYIFSISYWLMQEITAAIVGKKYTVGIFIDSNAFTLQTTVQYYDLSKLQAEGQRLQVINKLFG